MRIGTDWSQRPHKPKQGACIMAGWLRWFRSAAPRRPSDDEHEVVAIGKVQELPQFLNRPAPRRQRKRQHAGRATEPDRNVIGDPPSMRADLDAAPELIREIEVDPTIMLGHPQRDYAFRAVKLRLCFERFINRPPMGHRKSDLEIPPPILGQIRPHGLGEEAHTLSAKVQAKRSIIDIDRSKRERSSGIVDWPEGVGPEYTCIIGNLQEIKIIAEIKPEISVVVQGRLSVQEEADFDNAVVVAVLVDLLSISHLEYRCRR